MNWYILYLECGFEKMMRFVCKSVNIEDVLRCSFGLNRTELDILMLLLSSENEFTSSQIISKIKKDKSTVQRCLKSLVEKELVIRFQINLEQGGYYFKYRSVNKNSIKKKLNEIFMNFSKMVEKKIDSF